MTLGYIAIFIVGCLGFALSFYYVYLVGIDRPDAWCHNRPKAPFDEQTFEETWIWSQIDTDPATEIDWDRFGSEYARLFLRDEERIERAAAKFLVPL